MSNKIFAGDMDRLRAPERLARLELDRVLGESLRGLSAPRVLDVGTGTGVFAEAFLGRGLKVTGVDLSPDMLD